MEALTNAASDPQKTAMTHERSEKRAAPMPTMQAMNAISNVPCFKQIARPT